MTIVVEGYKELERALARFDPESKKLLNREIRRGATDIATVAKALAGFSKKIPPAIRTSVTQNYAVIRVRGVPIASLYERGTRGDSSGWRHPLFGDHDYWYEQKAHPYLKPAVRAGTPALIAQVERAIVALGRTI